MKQVKLVEVKKFEIEEVAIPEPSATQALIKVKAVGICGSDIHAYEGKHPFVHPPVVMGHEMTGEVVKVGDQVTNVKPGDRVIMRPQEVCGECYMCKHGQYNICKELKVIGCQSNGGSAEYNVVEADILYKLPDNVDYKVGTVIEPLAVGVHAVKRGAADIKGKKVLVIGAGTIGNVVAQSAMAMGADKVMITDVSDYKLNMAKECKVDYAVNVAQVKIEDELEAKFGPDGADVIFECSANDKALNQALDYARKGINIVIVGVYAGMANVNMANVQDREYSLVGTLMYLHEDYVDAIDMVKNNKVNLQALVSKEFPFLESDKAYKYIEENRDSVQKVILNVE